MIRRNGWLNISLLVLVILLFTSGLPSESTGWQQTDEILSRIKAPVFPETEFNILDFGAVNDGITDCSGAIEKAISRCHESGGGRVIIPEGKFLTGAIYMKSNVDLHLMKGATLFFSRDLEKYLPVVQSRFEGYDLMNYSPFIYAFGVSNIAITGQGTIDGNADTLNWWSWKGNTAGGWKKGMQNQQDDRKLLGEMAKKGLPVEQRVFGEGHFMRTCFIQFIQSKNILIEGITIIRSPMWEINPVLCTNVIVRGVHIDTHGPNNDGCNPESCRDVLIEDSFFNTGDDCIAIKSGREEDGRRVNVPSENIIVRNCRMEDGHGGVVIGSEITGGCRNVFIENCTMDSPNLERALRIKTNSLRGGLVENVYMRNVNIGKVKEAILKVNFYYGEGDIGDYTPVVRNIFLENITSEDSQYALWIKGYKRSPVSGIHLSNCHFNGVKDGNLLSEITELTFDKTYINNQLITLDASGELKNSTENTLQLEDSNKANP
jgi:polygalacturonase